MYLSYQKKIKKSTTSFTNFKIIYIDKNSQKWYINHKERIFMDRINIEEDDIMDEIQRRGYDALYKEGYRGLTPIESASEAEKDNEDYVLGHCLTYGISTLQFASERIQKSPSFNKKLKEFLEENKQPIIKEIDREL